MTALQVEVLCDWLLHRGNIEIKVLLLNLADKVLTISCLMSFGLNRCFCIKILPGYLSIMMLITNFYRLLRLNA